MERQMLARQVYLWLARIFLASVVVQVFLIGLYLFADADLNLHRLFAIVPTALSLIVLVAAFAARLPRNSKRWAGALFVVTFVQGILPGFKYAGIGVIGALHPVNALLVFYLGVVVLRDAQQQASMPDELPVAPG